MKKIIIGAVVLLVLGMSLLYVAADGMGDTAGIQANVWTQQQPQKDVIPLVVEGKPLEGAYAFITPDGIVMVPLQPVADALGTDVTWDEKSPTVQVGMHAGLTIGEDAYLFARMAPIQLGAAPEIVEGTIYVPMAFFTKIMQQQNAYFFEGVVFIDNEEKME